jgi:peptidoglycan/LPS O-acetylase OafA/YrhL
VSGTLGTAGRRRDIQGLRGVAVLLVVLYHAGVPVAGGFTGVDVFFAISGFVITTTLVAELSRENSLSLSRFYTRRVRRLFPALAVMLVVVAALGTMVSPFGAQTMAAATTAAAALFGANLYLMGLGTGYFDVQTTLNPLLHTWTLAVEEQFYLVFPVLLALGWRLGRRRGSFLAILAVSLGSFLLSHQLAGAGGTAGRFAFYGSPTRAWEFGVGALSALAVPALSRLPLLLSAGLGLLGAVLIDLGAFPVHSTIAFSGTAVPLAVTGACALLAAGTACGGPVTRLLETGLLCRVGDLSYSWYLWHWPLIVYASSLLPGMDGVRVIAAAASLVPAWLSYRYVEAPIRRRIQLRGRRVIALAAACIVVPVAAGGALAGVHTALGATSHFSELAATQQLHADVMRGCDNSTPLGARSDRACTWHVAAPEGKLVLVGDSNAGQFTEPVVRAGSRDRLDTTVATFSSCPFALLQLQIDGITDDKCERFVAGTLTALVRLRPQLVIIANRSDKYVEQSNISLRALPAPAARPGFVSDPQAKAEAYARGLSSVLSRLRGAGVRVVVIHPVPLIPFDPAGCAVIKVLEGNCSGTQPRHVVDIERRRAVWAEDLAVASVPTARTLDFENLLCEARLCGTRAHGTDSYLDESHLGVAGALLLTRRFEALIAP